METLLFMAIVLLAGAFVTAPLRCARDATVADTDVGVLEAARDAKLRELRDAELDFATGKLGDGDYEVVHATLRAEAAELLRRLDERRTAKGVKA